MTLALVLAFAATGALALFVHRSKPAVEAPRCSPGSVDDQLPARIERFLAGESCGACGYDSCQEYAEAVAGGSEPGDRCLLGGADCTRSIERLLREDRQVPASWGEPTLDPVPSARIAHTA